MKSAKHDYLSANAISCQYPNPEKPEPKKKGISRKAAKRAKKTFKSMALNQKPEPLYAFLGDFASLRGNILAMCIAFDCLVTKNAPSSETSSVRSR